MGIAATPYTAHNADVPTLPVLLSVPHAGRCYPDDLLANLRVSPAELLRLEDRYADRLVQPALAAGVPTLVAHSARAWIDLNRAENDIDSSMLSGSMLSPAAVPSAKTRGGLGLIPRRLQSSGELWRKPIDPADVARRIAHVHRPYHQTMSHMLEDMRARFGIAILLDVHSMPPIPAQRSPSQYGSEGPKIVVGDRFGRSAAAVYAELVLAHVRSQNIEGSLNSPYSGAYILAQHGRPDANIHALQLEVDRSLYLDSALCEPSDGLAATARLIHQIALLLADHALGTTFAQAAE